MENPKPKIDQVKAISGKAEARFSSGIAETQGVAVARPAKARNVGGTRYTAAEIHEIFRRFSVQRPEPKGELEHVNPFTLLVAVVLSAQATDAGVNKATRALFKVADTPEKMLAFGEEQGWRLYPDDRPLAQQGEECHRSVRGADRSI